MNYQRDVTALQINELEYRINRLSREIMRLEPEYLGSSTIDAGVRRAELAVLMNEAAARLEILKLTEKLLA